MAPSPLSQAVEHFTLAQLMADPNLCRNVLNDIGAQPAETFLLVAALEVRVPQTLIEHAATNDLAVVEPRLVGQLTERGIEQSRAVWAVDAWKEVVAGSALGLQTVRPADSAPTPAHPPVAVPPSQPATVRPSQPATVRPSQPAPTPMPAPVVPGPPSPPPSASSTTPMRPGGGRRGRKGVIAIATIAVLVIAAVVAFLAWPSGKKGKAAPSSSSSSHSIASTASSPSGQLSPSTSPPVSASSAASITAPVGNPNAPLGAAKVIAVPSTIAWTVTGLNVTKGERINVTATGQITHAAGQPCGPDGVSGNDQASIVGGGHQAGLIGLIGGSNVPFFIGANYNDLAPATGTLYLGINDVGLDNNAGKFTVTLRLQA